MGKLEFKPEDFEQIKLRLRKRSAPYKGCVIWFGAKTVRGYGCINYKGKNYGANRLAYMAHHKTELPSGLFVCHTCDNPACIKPDHLFLGTSKDNSKDMVNKKRNYQSKITHCLHGHEYTAENTIICTRKRNTMPYRICRTCNGIKHKRKRKPKAKWEPA